MLTSIIGLTASFLLYMVAIYAFLWTGKRRMKWGEQHGVPLSPEPKFPSAAELWKRHSVEMTVIYAGVFVALALMDFTIWGRLGFAALGALVFGSIWFANSPGDLALPGSSSAANGASKLGYWCLAVLDWLGYMGVLCFGTALLVEMVSA